jgi:bifunctional UDP-N-acetylglucosamine pyrophosphorylase / glucosamine-1-phosphate N-acetyltransferase
MTGLPRRDWKGTFVAPASNRSLAAVVLAGGRGRRMRSARPKVLHPVCGRPCLWHVLKAAAATRPKVLAVVISHDQEQVVAAVRSWAIRPEPVFVDQGEPLGTGHAVAAAEEVVAGCQDVVVLAGDDPLVTGSHVRDLMRTHRRRRAAATILTTVVDDPTGYGRVLRDGDRLVEIVEEREATPEVRAVREISTLVYAFRREDLFRALPLVGRENRQREHYLPDVLGILMAKGERVGAVPVDLGGGLGINSRRGLAKATAVLRARMVTEHMDRGVTFVDPDTAYVDVDVRIGPDTVIHPQTYLEGRTSVGARCSIGPSARLVDSTVGDGAEVSFSVLRESRVGPDANVGPFASLRPGTVLEAGAKAGTFVEIKASRVGRGAKVPHLSYIGDADVGAGANVGAATVTANYDGFEKHRTVIGPDARIGSDTMLVAPVEVGRGAFTGAGSVITRDVPAGALAIERAEQRIIPGYADRKRARSEAGARRGASRGTGRRSRKEETGGA